MSLALRLPSNNNRGLSRGDYGVFVIIAIVAIIGLVAIIQVELSLELPEETAGGIVEPTPAVAANSAITLKFEPFEVVEDVDSESPWGFNSESPGPTFKVPKGSSVTVVFENNGAIPHNWAIPELNIRTEIINPGDTATLEFTAEAVGNYVYVCEVPGHKELGMEGQLVVE